MKSGESFDFRNCTEQRKDEFVKGILSVQDLFIREFGIITYVDFGTLLGAVRDNNFIDYDTDIDMTYLSKFSDVNDIRKEQDKIYDFFKNKNMLKADFRTRAILPHYGQIHIKLHDIGMIVDITTGWIGRFGNYYVFPYGKIGRKEDVLPLKVIPFRKEFINVPNNSEKLLEFLYNDWRKPINRGGDGTSREGFKRSWNYKLLALSFFFWLNEIIFSMENYV